jgi:signal transduction histidine kinase
METIDYEDFHRTLHSVYVHELKNGLHTIIMEAHNLETRISRDKNILNKRPYFQHFTCLKSKVEELYNLVSSIQRQRDLLLRKKGVRVITSINKVIKDVVRRLDSSLLQKRLKVHYDLDPTLEELNVSKHKSLYVDPLQIEQLIANLLLNAIEATKPGRNIYVYTSSQESEDWMELRVKDSGFGIDEAVLPHIFDPFFSTKPDRLGLGLYICRHIIEQHLGTITFKSQLSKGTTVSIKLPKTVT